MLKSKYVLFILVALGLTAGLSKASSSMGQPYCGLYCIYSVMKIENMEVDFRDLVKPEYIGSRKGSSLAELKKCASDNGLEAVAVGRLSSSELKASPYPMILHTKSEPTKTEYDHYVLFLGTENGKAKIFDPPNPVELVSFAELAPNWDGNALIVANQPINLNKIFMPGRKRLIYYSAGAIVFILLARVISKKYFKQVEKNRTVKFGFSIAQACAFGGVALLAGLGYHFIDQEGFLASSGATATIEQAHIGNFIPKIDKDDTTKMLNTENTLIVDARMEPDYKAGHIENAVSIPVTLCDAGRAGVMKNVPKDKKVVVYCQSAGCKYAETVASKLIGDGYENVSIYKAGWMDWKSEDN